MRESKKGEKTRLPRDPYEAWLASQVPRPQVSEHRSPPEDVYDAWLSKRIREKEAETRAE